MKDYRVCTYVWRVSFSARLRPRLSPGARVCRTRKRCVGPHRCLTACICTRRPPLPRLRSRAVRFSMPPVLLQVFQPEVGKFPDFGLIEKLPVWETILEPGDMLFMPMGWIHSVKALSTSVSIALWSVHWVRMRGLRAATLLVAISAALFVSCSARWRLPLALHSHEFGWCMSRSRSSFIKTAVDFSRCDLTTDVQRMAYSSGWLPGQEEDHPNNPEAG